MARPRQISNEQILAAMRAAVLERGPSVSLDAVAASLGVTAPALIKRFKNRRQLMIEALRPSQRPAVLLQMEAGPDERPLAVQLEGLMVGLWEFLSEAIPCVAALRESGIPKEEVLTSTNGPRLLIGALSSWLKAAEATGVLTAETPATAATAIYGAVQAHAFTTHLLQKSFAVRFHRRYFRELSQLFARALAVKPGGRRRSS